MTGGRVVVLGRTGRNFAAGMSGGVAYVLDAAGDVPARAATREMVDLEPLDDAERRRARAAADPRGTSEYTGSAARRARARRLATTSVRRFVKVMPRDYKRVLQAQAQGGGGRTRRGVRGAGRGWPSMGKVTGFIEIARKKQPTRPVAERVHDWREVYLPYPEAGAAGIRGRAAWTAASRSAIRAARSAT